MKSWRQPGQPDSKSPDHPAREFGHEGVMKGSYDPMTREQTIPEAIARLAAKIGDRTGYQAVTPVEGCTVKVWRDTATGPLQYSVSKGSEALEEGEVLDA